MSPERRKSSRRPAPQEPADQDEEFDVLEPIADESEEFDTLEPIDDEEDLPTLEPVDDDEDLPTLEPVDDGAALPVHLESAVDDGYDVQLRIVLGDLDRAAILDAVEKPLRRAVNKHADELRWKRVRVLFASDEVAPSKVKALVEELFAAVKPTLVAVQRGYPDETVLENELPQAGLDVDAVDGDPQRLRVRVTGGGELETADLPVVLKDDIARLGADAEGKSFELSFAGAPQPASAFIEDLRSRLASGGAVRASVQLEDGGATELLFDRELEQVVTITEASADDHDTDLVLTPADDEDVTRRALEMVLPGMQGMVYAKRIRARVVGRELQPAEMAVLEQQLLALKLGRLEMTEDDGSIDVVLPHLLRTASKSGRTRLGVVLGGRDGDAALVAFRREVSQLGSQIAGQQVMVDWPEDFEVGEGLEKACGHEVLAPIGPASVTFSFRGKNPWPVLPRPLDFEPQSDDDGELVVARLDTDAGKPVELVHSIERRVRANAGHLGGKRVRVLVVGDGAVSRSMRRAVRAELEQVGAVRIEFVERDIVDVLLPDLLQVAGGGQDLELTIDPAGRSSEQLDLAVARELEDIEIGAGTTVSLSAGEATDAVCAAVVALGAGRVLRRDGDSVVQLHPALLSALRDGDHLHVTAAPHAAADEGVLGEQVARETAALLAEHGETLEGVEVTVVWPGQKAPHSAPAQALFDLLKGAGCAVLKLDVGTGRTRQLHPEVVHEPVHVLGRNDAATPPMKLLGIDWSADPEDAEALHKQLEAMLAELRDHRVLAVFQSPQQSEAEGHDIEAPDGDPMLVTLVSDLETVAGALLLYRGGARPHFQVVTSKVEGLEVGAKFNDPRAAAR